MIFLIILTILISLITVNCFGAEFLILARPHWYDRISDEEKTARELDAAEFESRYVIGDIVDVFPDGRLGQYADANGTFYVVRVKGLSVEEGKKYIEAWKKETVIGSTTVEETVRRRKYRLPVENLPSKLKKELKDYHVTVNWEDIKDYILNKVNSL